MDCLPIFSFPSANATFTTASSPSQTPRKSSHRRKQAVTVPVIATVNLRTPVHYTPPTSYHRTSSRRLANSLSAIPEGPASFRTTPRTVNSSTIGHMLTPVVRPGCFRSTSADSVTTTSSSCFDSDSNATPESCRFSNPNYSTSSAIESFPRLSICDIDDQVIVEEEDDEEFWHCAGVEDRDTLKASNVGAVDSDMADVSAGLFEKVQAWRDSM